MQLAYYSCKCVFYAKDCDHLSREEVVGRGWGVLGCPWGRGGAGRFAGRLFVCLSTCCSFTYFCSSSLYQRLRSLIVILPRDFFIICNKIESGVFISFRASKGYYFLNLFYNILNEL